MKNLYMIYFTVLDLVLFWSMSIQYLLSFFGTVGRIVLFSNEGMSCSSFAYDLHVLWDKGTKYVLLWSFSQLHHCHGHHHHHYLWPRWQDDIFPYAVWEWGFKRWIGWVNRWMIWVIFNKWEWYYFFSFGWIWSFLLGLKCTFNVQ